MDFSEYSELSWDKIMAKIATTSGKYDYASALRGPDGESQPTVIKSLFTGFIRGQMSFYCGVDISNFIITIYYAKRNYDQCKYIVEQIKKIDCHYSAHMQFALNAICEDFDGEVNAIASLLCRILQHGTLNVSIKHSIYKIYGIITQHVPK